MSATRPRLVYLIGTCDTKEAELVFAKTRVEAAGARAVLVDVSTGTGGSSSADVSAASVAACHPDGADAVFGESERGKAVTEMGRALTAYLQSRDDIGAVLGLGGSGNSAIVTAAMRSLPVGVPKLMVSTMASGDVSDYVGGSDIAMLYPVVDVAGLNATSRLVIGNAAHAVAGMAANAVPADELQRQGLGLTMFGVTTKCVSAIRSALEASFECFVFSANGIGGRSMEKLVDDGLIKAVIDITTTEVADRLVGGVLACTDDRFGAILRSGAPYIGSVGALDMVNFGARETVPPRFACRHLHLHNDQVTLMRTTPEENRAIGKWIVERLNRMTGPVRFLLPLRGVSALDAPGQAFHDPAADAALFEAIQRDWVPADNRRLIEVDTHINDPGFAAEVVRQFNDLMNDKHGQDRTRNNPSTTA